MRQRPTREGPHLHVYYTKLHLHVDFLLLGVMLSQRIKFGLSYALLVILMYSCYSLLSGDLLGNVLYQFQAIYLFASSTHNVSHVALLCGLPT